MGNSKVKGKQKELENKWVVPHEVLELFFHVGHSWCECRFPNIYILLMGLNKHAADHNESCSPRLHVFDKCEVPLLREAPVELSRFFQH